MGITFDSHKNLAYSAVATAPSPPTSGTSLTLTAGDGAKLPSPPFNMTVWPGGGATASQANAEIVRVTGVTGDILAIVRAQEGTTAQSVAVGYQIALTATAKVFTDIEAALNATLGGGLGGTLPNPSIATGAVATAQLAANAATQAVQASGSVSGPTTASTTPVAMPDMSVTLTTLGGPLLVFYSAVVQNSTTADVFVGPSLDGAASPNAAIVFAQGTDWSTVSGLWLYTGVASGSHTVSLLWNVDSGTGGANSTRRQITVLELRR